MKKALSIALGTVVAAAVAVPALADHQLGGYFRTKMIRSDISFTKDGNDNPDTLIDQRLRLRWQNNINEYISVVYFGEVDFQWGDKAFANGRGDGGAIGGDSVNLETKNAFASVKIPNTPVSAIIGLQNVNAGGNLIIDDDAAAVQIAAKMDMVNVNLQYSKFSGDDSAADWKAENDQDFWGVEVGLAPMAGLNVGINGYWLNNNLAGGDLYWLEAQGTYKVGMVNLEGILGYNFGSESEDVDVSGYFASLRGAASVAGADVALRAFYMSGDNDSKDANYYHGAKTNAAGGSNMGGSFSYGLFDGLMIFMPELSAMTYAFDAYAFTDAGFTDHGLMALVATAKYVPPALKAMYIQGAAGYFAAVEDKTKRIAARDGTTLGTEVALHVGYKFAEKFDVSLNGAIAFLGDFYDGTAAGGEDPDDPYKLFAMVNIPY